MNERKRTIVAAMLKDRRFGKEQNRRVYSAEGIAPAILTMQGGNREPKILMKDERREEDNGETLSASQGLA